MINDDQLENLYKILQEKSIKIDWLKKALNIENLSKISVRQYNYLLIILKKEGI